MLVYSVILQEADKTHRHLATGPLLKATLVIFQGPLEYPKDHVFCTQVLGVQPQLSSSRDALLTDFISFFLILIGCPDVAQVASSSKTSHVLGLCEPGLARIWVHMAPLLHSMLEPPNLAQCC